MGPRSTKRSRWIVLVTLLALFGWASLFVWVLARQDDSEAAKAPDASHPADKAQGAKAIDEVSLHYVYDIQDERLVVGLSENVFAARVEHRSGTEPATTSIPKDKRPQTQYTVRVIKTIKSTGPAPLEPGEVATVNREGGVSPVTGTQQVVVGDYCGTHAYDSPLEVGSEYLFATYYEPGRRLHTLVAQPTGARLIGSREELGALVAAYRVALEQQENPMSLAGSKGERPACD